MITIVIWKAIVGLTIMYAIGICFGILSSWVYRNFR